MTLAAESTEVCWELMIFCPRLIRSFILIDILTALVYTHNQKMPVTKTAKKALRSAQNKQLVNKIITSNLEASVRIAKKTKKEKDIKIAGSLADRAVKKRVIHKNKAARLKSQLAKLLTPKKTK